MLKNLLLLSLLLFAAATFATVDLNKADVVALDGVKGIGPGLSTRILDERRQRQFSDWNDFIVRIKGIGRKKAAALSREGLTINGEAYADAPAAAQRKDAAED
ncbi:MAG: helix-hairpin-helix domain-containing protein [Proteobacteria bacterium]|nr:helix-hairpin-helix domain-containing protein [Pseudomonadota bacterium]